MIIRLVREYFISNEIKALIIKALHIVLLAFYPLQGADLAFFQGGGLTQRREPIFFFCGYFEPP